MTDREIRNDLRQLYLTLELFASTLGGIGDMAQAFGGSIDTDMDMDVLNSPGATKARMYLYLKFFLLNVANGNGRVTTRQLAYIDDMVDSDSVDLNMAAADVMVQVPIFETEQAYPFDLLNMLVLQDALTNAIRPSEKSAEAIRCVRVFSELGRGVISLDENEASMQRYRDFIGQIRDYTIKCGNGVYSDADFAFLADGLGAPSANRSANAKPSSGMKMPSGRPEAGCAYAVAGDGAGNALLYRVETQLPPGNGAYNITGPLQQSQYQSVIMTVTKNLFICGEDLGASLDGSKDYHINVITQRSTLPELRAELAAMISVYSAMTGQPALEGLVVLGSVDLDDTVLVPDGIEKLLRHCADVGAKKVLLPIAAAADARSAPGDILSALELIYFSTPHEAVRKALGLEQKPVVKVARGDFDLDSSGKLIRYKGHDAEPALPEGVTIIADGAFKRNQHLVSIAIPEGVREVGSEAFRECYQLERVTFPASLRRIGKGAFENCEQLTALEFPNGLVEIDNSAFSNCKMLSAVDLPKTLRSIGEDAFSSTALRYVFIPEGVTAIRKHAFMLCRALKRVYAPSSVSEIGDGVFDICPDDLVVHSPKGSAIKAYAKNCGVKTGSRPASDASVVASAEEAEMERQHYFILSKGELANYYGEQEDLVLPDGIKFVSKHAFHYSLSLRSIVIPEGVESIEAEAFCDCRLLEKVSLPSTLRTIGRSAFSGCRELKSLVIPEGVEEIPDLTFCGCAQLKHISLPGTLRRIGDSAFMGCYRLSSVAIPSGVIEIKGNAFGLCKSLQTVILPDTLQTIGDGAFEACFALRDIYVPSSVETIGPHVFGYGFEKPFTIHAPHGSAMEAYALERAWKVDDQPASASVLEAASAMEEAASESVHEAAVETALDDFALDPEGRPAAYKGSARSIILPRGLTRIDPCSGYERLISIIVPEGVEELGEEAFEDCVDLESVSLPSTLKRIESEAFVDCQHLRELTIPEGVEVIERFAFSGCHNLRSIHLPDSLKAIKEGAFADCAQLTDILIPGGVQEIGSGAFKNCVRLCSVSISGSVKRMETELFINCKSLAGISVPEGAEEVCERAFQNCKNLKSVTLPNTLKAIRANAFYDCSKLADIYAPASVTEIDESAFSYAPSLVVHATWGSAMEAYAKKKNYRLGAAAPLRETGDGFVIDANGELVAYKGYDAQITLPANITGIAGEAFMRNQEIVSVTVPEGIREIGEAAFKQCYNLERVSLPKSLNRIGVSAFAHCEQLSGIVIPEGVKTIASSAFSSCGELKSVSLSEGLESIEASAFRFCRNLERICLPKSLRKIGNEAFALSINLKDIQVPASTIEIGKSIFDYTSNDLVIHTPLGSSMDVYAKKLGLKVDNPPAAVEPAPRYSIPFLRELWPNCTEEELKAYQREMNAMDPEQAEALIQVTRAHNEIKRDVDRLTEEVNQLTNEAPPEQSTVYRIAHVEHSREYTTVRQPDPTPGAASAPAGQSWETPATKEPDPNSRAARRQRSAARPPEEPERKEPDPNSRAARRQRRNAERKKELQEEIRKLEREKASLEGFLGGIKKIQLQRRINELKDQLQSIK